MKSQKKFIIKNDMFYIFLTISDTFDYLRYGIYKDSVIKISYKVFKQLDN